MCVVVVVVVLVVVVVVGKVGKVLNCNCDFWGNERDVFGLNLIC